VLLTYENKVMLTKQVSGHMCAGGEHADMQGK
jgi:hypothetical protein